MPLCFPYYIGDVMSTRGVVQTYMNIIQLAASSYSIICDWACESQPCEHKEISDSFVFALYKLFILMHQNLLLLQNLLGFLLRFTEMEYLIQRWRY